jgi:hypothetical protein
VSRGSAASATYVLADTECRRSSSQTGNKLRTVARPARGSTPPMRAARSRLYQACASRFVSRSCRRRRCGPPSTPRTSGPKLRRAAARLRTGLVHPLVDDGASQCRRTARDSGIRAHGAALAPRTTEAGFSGRWAGRRRLLVAYSLRKSGGAGRGRWGNGVGSAGWSSLSG